MLAESVSSPLPALTSSPAPSVHSLPLDDKTSSDHQAESSDGKDSSDENFSRDPTYQPEFQIALTPTLTPLKNKPFANRSISTSSASNLMKNGHKPNVCIVTRQDKNTGIPITRPHMIPQATKLKDLRIFEWLLGYKAGTFNLDSHFNLTFMSQHWHTMFDEGKWAMVPEEPVRKEILRRLIEAKDEVQAEGSSEGISAWPHFTKIFLESDGIYRFRLVNISLQMVATVYDGNKKPHIVDLNSEHPFLTMESHVHPLHVIINAHLKFRDWDPSPSDPPTLAIIDDIHKIWEVWSSIPPTQRYLSHGLKDRADHSSLGPPSETRTRSRSGKRSDRDGDGESSRESRVSKRERRSGGAEDGDVLESGQLTDGTPSLDLSSSDESRDNLSDFEYSGDVQAWRDTLQCVQTFSPRDFEECNEVNAGIGSPKVTEYKCWKPRWDRRWVDTSSFSSNDWAYYRRRCNLTASSRLSNTS